VTTQLASLLVLLATAMPAHAATVGTECYGDAIDVDLNNGPGTPAAHLRVPLSFSPAIFTRDGSVNPPDPMQECMPEPLAAESIFLTFNHHGVPELGWPEDLSVKSLLLRYGGGAWNAEFTAIDDERIEGYVDSGVSVVMPNGFTKLFPTPDNGGQYLSPPDYLEVGGRRVSINCGPMAVGTQCDTSHGAGNNVSVHYRFDYAKIDPMRWRELDLAVNAAALQLLR